MNPFKKRAIKKIVDELSVPYPLPLGRKEFEVWSNKIIVAAEIPGATIESQQFALAEMVLHCKPNESFVPLGHFVHSLRKGAASQVCHTIFQEIKRAQQQRVVDEQKVLEDGKVSAAGDGVDTEIEGVGV